MKANLYERLAIAAALAVTWSGCAYEMDGPEPAVSSDASPHLVCNEQLQTPVDVAGSGFSPRPVDTATGEQLLELPTITLDHSADLTGGEGTGESTVVPDDPENPESSQVRWHSQERMTFVVDEELGLAEGIHQVTVENPNGHQEVFSDALAAVPPPTLDAVEPMAICLAQEERMLEFQGQGFLDVNGSLPSITFASETDPMFSETYTPDSLGDCTTLPNPASDTDTCNNMVLTIPADDLPPDTYSVVVTNPEPAACSSTTPISVDVVPPPDLQAVSPTRICEGGGNVELTGENFREGATVTAGGTEAGSVNVAEGGESADATFGAGVPEGTHDVTIENPEGCTDTLPDALEVVQGPILFFIDPPVVFNGISTQITLFLSGAGGQADQVTITPSDGGDPIELLDAPKDVENGRLQVVIPTDTPAATYDVAVEAAGCGAALPGGLTVTDELTLDVDDMDPEFGDEEDDTPVSIFGDGFVNAPRVYLNPDAAGDDTVAVSLESVSFIDETRLTAVVPPGQLPGLYDLYVVNPTGEVGLLEDAFRITTQDPPVIDHVLPGEVENDEPQEVTAEGENLGGVDAAEWDCKDPDDGSVTTIAGALGEITDTTADVTLDANMFPRDTVCVLRLFDGNVYAEYSAVAITEPASNLAPTEASTDMTRGRRAHALVSGRVTRASRFLYAIGGDNGMTDMPHDTSESASVDLFGELGTWFEQPNRLPQGTTFTDAWNIGRYIYLVGGSDGSDAVNDVWRAKILDPDESPIITDISPEQGEGAGLGAGVWYYRVSAVMPEGHPENPSGETLASDPLVIQLPEELPDTLIMTIFWSEVPGAESYNVYRSPDPDMGPDSVELLENVPATQLDYEDTGGATMEGTSPLPFGAHGTWAAMPSLNTPREAAGLGHATDPDPALSDVHYLYAVGGRDEAGEPLDTYEYLAITDEGQTAPGPWVPGTETLDEDALAGGGDPTPAPRAELGVYSANRFTAPHSLSDSEQYIYAAGGIGDMTYMLAEAASVTTGGQLGPFEDITGLMGGNAGFSYMTGNGFLYLFGGGPTPADTAVSAEICHPDICPTRTVPEVVNWNAQGWELTTERYQSAGTIESAHVFIVGGTADGTTALMSTESTVW